MLGVLSQLVVLSMVVERAFAFIFEQEWVASLLSKNAPDPADPTKKIRVPRSGLKSLVVAACSVGVAFNYQFDVLPSLLSNSKDSLGWLGFVITGLIIAGGSAGAIVLFQGVLGLNKDARDAKVEASKTSAQAEKTTAEADKAKAQAALTHAAADNVEADTHKATAEAALKTATETKPG